MATINTFNSPTDSPTAATPVTPLRESGSAWSGLRRNETLAGYLFLLPNLIGFLIFSLIPIVAAFGLTFTNWNMIGVLKFAGLANYQKLMHDALFWQVAKNTIVYTLGAVPAGVFIAFWLALLLNREMRGVVFFRTIFFLPHVTLTVAVALVWSWLYQPELGLINAGLERFGIDGPRWLQSTDWAMPAIIIMSNWKGIGFAMMIFLAGLQAIPQDLLEAATVDGASWFQRLRDIVIPLLAPTTFFILVTSFIGAMQAFDQFYVMTAGGPAYATTTLVVYIFQSGFQFFQMGYAATIAFMLFLSIFVITAIQWRFGRVWAYGNEGAE